MPFPKSTTSKAYETAISILKNDPILSREVKTFSHWSGSPSDIQDFSVGQSPWLNVTPHAQKSEFFDNKSHKEHLLLEVQLGVEGTDATQIMDFWGAIEKAFFPTDATQYAVVQARVAAAGIIAVEFTQPAWDVNSQGGQALVGKGQIELWFYTTQKSGADR